MARALTWTAHAESATVCYRVCGNWTVIAGRIYDLNHIVRWAHVGWALGERKVYSLPYNLPLLVDAAVIAFRTRDHAEHEFFFFFGIESVLPCKTADFLHNLVLERNYAFVIRYHNRTFYHKDADFTTELKKFDSSAIIGGPQNSGEKYALHNAPRKDRLEQ